MLKGFTFKMDCTNFVSSFCCLLVIVQDLPTKSANTWEVDAKGDLNEEGGTRRTEGRGGRRDEESEKMKELLKKMKNEKVAKGRIISLDVPC